MRKKSQFRYFSALSFDFCVTAGFSNSFSGKEKKIGMLKMPYKLLDVKKIVELCCNVKYISILIKVLKLKSTPLLKNSIKWNKYSNFLIHNS